MGELERPIEVLELTNGQSMSFRVLRWEQGSVTIFPRHAPAGKTVNALRVHVPPDDKSTFPHYWDLLAERLVLQMHAELQRADFQSLRFTITPNGFPPKRYYTVDRAPIGAAVGGGA